MLLMLFFAKSATYSSFRSVVLRMRRKRAPVPRQVRERKFGKDSGRTAHQVLEFLSEQPEMTVPELARRLGLTTRAIEKQIAKLRDAKLLLRTGGRKVGRWEVLK